MPPTLAALTAGRVEAARLIVIDRCARYHQHRSNGEDAEQCRQPEHGRETELPSEQTRQTGAHHVAGMIERLIVSVLPVEAGLANDTERDAGHGGPNRRARHGGRDLRNRHQPEILRQQDDPGCYHRAYSGDDDVAFLVFGRIDQGARRRGHQQPSDTAYGHHRPNQSALPAMRQ
jgi:hypothetical protein